MVRTNAEAGICIRCDGDVAPGEGSLWWESGPDDGGDVVGRTPAGWRVSHMDAAACTAQLARRAEERAASRERARVAAEQVERDLRAALDQQQAEIDRLLAEAGCDTASGYSWSSTILATPPESVHAVALPTSTNPAFAGLSLGHSSWSRAHTTDGETVYLHSFGNATILYAPRDVVVRAWERLASPEGWRGYRSPEEMACGYTVEACREWLDELSIERAVRIPRAERRPLSGLVAGWEARAWLAGRVDLLHAEGVLTAPPEGR